MSTVRKQRVVSYVNEEELKVIEGAAKIDDRTVSDFVRRAALIVSQRVVSGESVPHLKAA